MFPSPDPRLSDRYQVTSPVRSPYPSPTRRPNTRSLRQLSSGPCGLPPAVGELDRESGDKFTRQPGHSVTTSATTIPTTSEATSPSPYEYRSSIPAASPNTITQTSLETRRERGLADASSHRPQPRPRRRLPSQPLSRPGPHRHPAPPPDHPTRPDRPTIPPHHPAAAHQLATLQTPSPACSPPPTPHHTQPEQYKHRLTRPNRRTHSGKAGQTSSIRPPPHNMIHNNEHGSKMINQT
jgi:hypothetical protein